jgi:hypothetical protein
MSWTTHFAQESLEELDTISKDTKHGIISSPGENKFHFGCAGFILDFDDKIDYLRVYGTVNACVYRNYTPMNKFFNFSPYTDDETVFHFNTRVYMKDTGEFRKAIIHLLQVSRYCIHERHLANNVKPLPDDIPLAPTPAN